MQRHTSPQNAPSDTCPHHLLICLVVVRKKGSSCGHGRPYHTDLLDEVRSIAGLGSHHKRLVKPLLLAQCKILQSEEATTRNLQRLYPALPSTPQGRGQQQLPNAHQEHIENGSLCWGVAPCSIAQSHIRSNHQCQRLTCVIIVSHQS